MADYLESLLAALSSVDPLWAYGILVLSAFLENIVPPIPGDTVVVFSAYLVGRGLLGIWPVFLATCVGGMAGFLVMYYLGYSRGRAFFAGRRGAAKLAQAEQLAQSLRRRAHFGQPIFEWHSVGYRHRRWLGAHALANRCALRLDRHGGLERTAALRRIFGGRELGTGH